MFPPTIPSVIWCAFGSVRVTFSGPGAGGESPLAVFVIGLGAVPIVPVGVDVVPPEGVADPVLLVVPLVPPPLVPVAPVAPVTLCVPVVLPGWVDVPDVEVVVVVPDVGTVGLEPLGAVTVPVPVPTTVVVTGGVV